MTEYHTALAEKISETAGVLAGENQTLKIIETSFRQYSVQAELLEKDGNINGGIILYFSPKRGAFTLKPLHKIPAEIFGIIESIINGKVSGSTARKSRKQEQYSGKLKVYVDGSYLGGKVGYGLVIVKNNEIVFEMSGSVDNLDYVAARQVAGELFSVGKAVQWCRNNSVSEIDIYYDYAGIEAWATGKWKTNQNLTKNYREYILNCGLKIHWHKVAAHTGDKWNEYADSLAKNGATKIENKQ